MRVVVIAFAPRESLQGYQQRQHLEHLLVLADPERRAYHAFGLGRGSIARVWLDPRVWIRYIRLIRAGGRLEAAHEDTMELGRRRAHRHKRTDHLDLPQPRPRGQADNQEDRPRARHGSPSRLTRDQTNLGAFPGNQRRSVQQCAFGPRDRRL